MAHDLPGRNPCMLVRINVKRPVVSYFGQNTAFRTQRTLEMLGSKEIGP